MNNKEDRYWQQLRNESHDNTFPRLEAWVSNLNSEKSQHLKLNKIQSMKNFFAIHKFKLVYSFILLAVVFAACNMPVTQNETVGHALTWKVLKNNTDAVSKIGALSWVDKSKVSVQEINEGNKISLSYSLVVNTSSKDELHNYMKQLRDIDGIASVQLYPLNQTTKLPLYAAALHSFFRIDIDATNKSEDQVKAELQKQLKEAGIDNFDIDYKKDGMGKGMMVVKKFPGDMPDNGKDFELNISDGNNKEFLKTLHNDDNKTNFEGKTDDEIRKMVAENMRKDGIDVKPEDLKIERDEQGKLKIKFEREAKGDGTQKQDHIEIKVK